MIHSRRNSTTHSTNVSSTTTTAATATNGCNTTTTDGRSQDGEKKGHKNHPPKEMVSPGIAHQPSRYSGSQQPKPAHQQNLDSSSKTHQRLSVSLKTSTNSKEMMRMQQQDHAKLQEIHRPKASITGVSSHGMRSPPPRQAHQAVAKSPAIPAQPPNRQQMPDPPPGGEEAYSACYSTTKIICMLLALPCGKCDDIIYRPEPCQQASYSTYNRNKLQGIVNVADPGSQQPAYVVHIFSPCGFHMRHLGDWDSCFYIKFAT
ncbi:unnamed protein product [Mytilus edulis]|uniref:Uncharacterized protein n=1 Tax=Mytilus edulis TaxID=6550 RepID=A0A8S3QTX9_MYTED|nr:unnamed protein product [Mytilus edulis]